MKVAIIYYRLFDYDGKEQHVGGIETYLLHLAELCTKLGYDTILFQCSNKTFKKTINNLNVIGVAVANLKLKQQKIKLYEAAIKDINPEKDIIIFGADHCSIKTDNKRCIAIQHGVSWDLPTRYFTKKKFCESGLGAVLKKGILIRNSIKFFENCQNRVCVDYNFLNWYRTMLAVEPKGKIWVIPNFASLIASPEQITARKQNDDNIRILFARRFTPYRGVRIMAEVTEEIVRRYNNVNFTFAGEGPEEGYLKERFSKVKQVTFTKYLPNEVLNIHLAHDIAVVPSIASEGTSLSVAEAMGAGCVVVATAVGGITNMVINDYNGILVMPNVSSLLSGIELVIKNPVLRKQLQIKAYETARNAFNLELWENRWRKVFEEVAGE